MFVFNQHLNMKKINDNDIKIIWQESQIKTVNKMFEKKGKKGNVGAAVTIVASTIAIVLGVILMVGVAIPTTSSVVTAQNFSGVNDTIADNLVTMILIGVLVLIVTVAVLGFLYVYAKQ